jgi:hypothetical protein
MSIYGGIRVFLVALTWLFPDQYYDRLSFFLGGIPMVGWAIFLIAFPAYQLISEMRLMKMHAPIK